MARASASVRSAQATWADSYTPARPRWGATVLRDAEVCTGPRIDRRSTAGFRRRHRPDGPQTALHPLEDGAAALIAVVAAEWRFGHEWTGDDARAAKAGIVSEAGAAQGGGMSG